MSFAMVDGVGERSHASDADQLEITFAPILDVAHGCTAGYQTRPKLSTLGEHGGSPLDLDIDGSLTATVIKRALTVVDTLPPNTFLSVPVGAHVAATHPVRDALVAHGRLAGVVLDLTGFVGGHAVGALDSAIADYRTRGALVGIGGAGAAQPELSSIVRFQPAFLRLGRDWVRGVDESESKRSAIEVIGQLAGQLDAWVLAEGIEKAGELRALAGLGVPLAQGSFIGVARSDWSAVDARVVGVLPRDVSTGDGALSAFVQPAYTARSAAAAAAVLPEVSGFDVVVIVDADDRPESLLERTPSGSWVSSQVMAVNVNTPVADVIVRAMTRPRATRFAPLACTGDTGALLGIVPIERLMRRLGA